MLKARKIAIFAIVIVSICWKLLYKMIPLLQNKPRFEILDGLRGVAAVIVVIYHIFETYSAGHRFQIVNHGYLAVDFFFMLSGFVIGYAYDDRWKVMSVWGFMKRRLIRLQPMVVLGCVIGAFWYYFGDSPQFAKVIQTPWWMVLVILLLGCIMFPTPPSMDIRGWRETNSLNGAQWSLMWEYIANLLYAFVIRRFGKGALWVFVIISSFLLIDVCLDLNVFGVLPVRGSSRFSPVGGWSLTSDQLYIGVSRLLFPFFFGLLIFRLSKWRINIGRFAMLITAFLVIVILSAPYVSYEGNNWLNGVYCLFAIFILFPIIISIGAGSVLTGVRTIKLCRFFGLISYPLYVTHYPMIYAQMSWVHRHPDAPLSTHIWVGVCIFVASIAVAYASVVAYDVPVRAWLSARFVKK